MILEEHEAHTHYVFQKRACRSALRFVSSGKLQIPNRRRFECSKLCDLTRHPPTLRQWIPTSHTSMRWARCPPRANGHLFSVLLACAFHSPQSYFFCSLSWNPLPRLSQPFDAHSVAYRISLKAAPLDLVSSRVSSELLLHYRYSRIDLASQAPSGRRSSLAALFDSFHVTCKSIHSRPSA